MSGETDFDAEIREHTFRMVADFQILHGRIYGDKKGRFVDGEWIHTSQVLKIEGDLVYTSNSIYKVVS